MRLEHKENHTWIEVNFRIFEPRDVYEVIACIKDEYQGAYLKQKFYNPDFIQKEHEAGRIVFLVAEADHTEIAGIVTLSRPYFQEEAMLEVATCVLKKKYRGYGLGEGLLDYGIKVSESMPCPSVFMHPVTYHNIVQKIGTKKGFVTTGILFSVLDMGHVIHSFEESRILRQSAMIQVKRKDKTKVGTLYIPEEHKQFTTDVYTKLGVEFEIETNCLWSEDSVSSCVCNERIDVRNSFFFLLIVTVGENLMDIIEEKLCEYGNKEKYTMCVLLNVNDKQAVVAYECLKEKGFFFAGYKSLCGKHELMVMHHPMQTPMKADGYVFSEESQKLMDYIYAFYNKSKKDRT